MSNFSNASNTSNPSNASNVIELNDTNFDSAIQNSSMPVVVKFGASWCGPCRMMNPIFSQIADDYVGKVKVCEIDIDKNIETVSKFDIMSVPTIIVFFNGAVQERMIGARSKDELISVVENCLSGQS